MNDNTLRALLERLDARTPALSRYDSAYNGTSPLTYLSPEAKKALGNRLDVMTSNVCRPSVLALAERLRVTGLGDDPALWAAWRRNDLDQMFPLAARDALTLGSAYFIVWADSAGRAQVSVESARQVATLHDPGTREVIAAVKRWETATSTEVVVYEPDTVTRLRAERLGATSGFTTVSVIDNVVGEVIVTPLLNTDRLLDVEGRSELADVLPLQDGLSKLLSDMMVSSEYFARPRRWATGVELEEVDVLDAEGQPTGETLAVNPYDDEGISMMASESPEAKFGQLPASDLAAYDTAVASLMAQISTVSGLPPHMLGVVNNQPTSADALRASEAALTARTEAKQALFGKAIERVGRHILAVETGTDPATHAVSVSWADAATRSVAQEADAVVKLHAAGLLPATSALRRLGYSDDEVARIRADRRAEALDGSGADLDGLLTRGGTA